jgi:hypothetical protein
LPRVSVKRKSTNLTSFSSIIFITSCGLPIVLRSPEKTAGQGWPAECAGAVFCHRAGRVQRSSRACSTISRGKVTPVSCVCHCCVISSPVLPSRLPGVPWPGGQRACRQDASRRPASCLSSARGGAAAPAATCVVRSRRRSVAAHLL